ncbi:MAG: glycosyltransferase family 2 protein [Verrucomicrobia bacterium]|nr:glycosyltransferase family 2 protein [Verrucomicrobiota bacterium]
MELVALIPAYREERYIADVVQRCRAQVGRVLVVDDGSGDRTGELAAQAGAELLRHDVNKGKGAAIKTGLRHLVADGVEWIMLLDGDGQHLPEEIARFRAAAEAEPDVRLWLGNRMADTTRMPAIRRATNRFMSWLLSRVCRQRIPDSQCGFRLVHRTIAPRLECETTGFDYESEMLIRLSREGERIGAVPVTTVYRDEVSSIRPAADTVKFFRLIFRYWGK